MHCSAAMTERRVAVAGLSLLLAACGGFTSISPTAPSATSSSQISATASLPGAAPTPTHAVGPDVPSGLVPSQQTIAAAVGPLADYPAPCYVERYACERYRFTMEHDGAAEVTLSWQGGARAMLIQLYLAGAGLVHEDVAPRDGAPTITFRRTLPALDYELRVVNMEPAVTHPFTMTLTTWQ